MARKMKRHLTGMQAVCERFVSDGWLSPDTYATHFADFGDFPAIYAFIRLSRENYVDGCAAYVGMSTNLAQRMNGHEILRDLEHPEWWVKRMFKPTDAADLRRVEASLIAAHSPPWNIIGRTRGLQ